MSITIRKYEGGDVFDLHSGYVIEAEKNNPVFEKKGSQTVPVNFPASLKNNRLLNFPFRLDRTSRQEETIDVLIETGSVQQRGLLSVNSATRQTISANIGYDESEMYATMKNMKLRDIPLLNDPEFIKSFGGNNIDEKINSMLSHLTGVMKQQIQADYYIFQVLLKTEKTEEKTYYEILNEVDNPTQFEQLPYGRISDLLALENRIITRYEEGEEIKLSVPKGYGVSPFLKVYRILEIIFQNFKFNIDENPFKTHRQLKKLVALNNTIDAVLKGTLYYKDLMPDVTINDFLDSLFFKFGMVYFVDSNSKKIKIKFIKDLLNFKISEMIDFNINKNEEPSISFSKAKQLRLKMNREQENSEVLYDTFEEFLAKFNHEFSEGSEWPDHITQFFSTYDSKYSIINIFNNDPQERNLFSSDFFDWDKKTENVEYEDITMKDMCLPIRIIPGAAYKILQYHVGFKHQYSDIIVDGVNQEQKENQAKIAFSFAWGMTYGTNPNKRNYFFSSQFNRDENGDFIYDNGEKYNISLTCNREDGLYNRFWKEYDAFIRHSNQEVRCNLHLSDNEFINLKMYQLAFINNQPLLPLQVKYKFNDFGYKISECKFRTLRLFKPYDLEEEQSIPQYHPQKYYWKFSETETNPDPRPSGYVSTNRIELVFNQRYFIINGLQVPIIYPLYLPPTEEQYTIRERRIYKYLKIYYITVKIGVLNIEQPHPSEVTITYFPESVN